MQHYYTIILNNHNKFFFSQQSNPSYRTPAANTRPGEHNRTATVDVSLPLPTSAGPSQCKTTCPEPPSQKTGDAQTKAEKVI